MANKKRLKRNIKQLQRIKTWQLIILLILSLLLTATFLRLNNIGMIQRRTAVLEADKRGDALTTQARLFDLQRYSAAHMNADSDVFYLEQQYKRDVKKAIDAASSNDPSKNINVKADQTCKRQYGGYSQAYVQCFASELAKAPAGVNAPDRAQLPEAKLYRHDFVSPRWSPDFAGYMVLITSVITLAIVMRSLSLLLLRLLLRRHYASI